MAFTLAGFIQDVDKVEASVKAELAKFEADLAKAMPDIQKVFAALAAAAPFMGIIDPELAPAVPAIEAICTAAPTVANNMLTAVGSQNAKDAITNTAATLLSVGQAAQKLTTGGALTTTDKLTASVTNIATNAVNMLVAGQAAIAAATPAPQTLTEQEAPGNTAA
jgi:hypothetical protein